MHSVASVGLDHGIFLSSHNVCLLPISDGTAQGDDVSTEGTVRASILSARARQRMTDRPSAGQTVCPFSVELVFDASLLHEIARTQTHG